MEKLNFVDKFVVLNNNEDVKVVGEKTRKQAVTALTTQINILEGEKLDKEDSVETARESLNNAKVNFGKPITDRVAYKTQLLEKKQELIVAEAALTTVANTLKFLKETLEEIQ